MKIFNFHYPFAAGVVEQIEDFVKESVEVQDIKCQIDQEESFGLQAVKLLDQITWHKNDWQTEKFMICLPGLANIAAVVLTEIHGRCGYFPSIIRLKPVANSQPPQFVLAEVINLFLVRNLSRERR